MRNLIYQYWIGPDKPGVTESVRLMKAYAKRIGAEYRFDNNIKIASHTVDIPIYYEPANPLVDESFDVYDNVALVDIDVFPSDGLTDDLFANLTDEDAGICTEPQQPHFRQIYQTAGIVFENDLRWSKLLKDVWNIDYPVDAIARPKVFNTGVVVISKKGLQKMKKEWPTFQEYVNVLREANGFPRFYLLFQDYFSAFIHMGDFKLKEMPNSWNCYMHKLDAHPNASVNDTRPVDAKLIHVMFRGADDWPADALWRVVNLPVALWNLPVNANWPNND
jgi:hypothetical protein|tara:strand:+ start:4243 stop:5073 length:831 start_codon:yes stop_codon:yes gene_type:complete